MRRNRAKAYKEIQKLKVQWKKKSREADKYRKRLERLCRTSEKSPRKYLNVQLRGSKVRENVKKELLFNCVIAHEIRRKMAVLKIEKQSR